MIATLIINIFIALLAAVTAIISAYDFPKKEENTTSPKWLKKSVTVDKAGRRKRNALILMALAMLVLTVSGIFFQKSSDKAKDEYADSLMQKITSLEASQKELVTTSHTIRDYLYSGVNKFGDNVKIGRTIYGVFSIQSNTSKSKGFLFDIGYHEYKSRVSIYLNEYDDLIYRVIGDDGTVYSIKVPVALNKFELNRAYLIYADYGISDTYSFMRLFLNKKEMGTLQYNSRINFPTEPIKNQLKMGIDITNSFAGRFSLLTYGVEQNPWPTSTRIDIMGKVINTYSIQE